MYQQQSDNYTIRGFSFLPPVVKNLLILNVLFFLADVSLRTRGIDLTQWLGLHYITAQDFYPWQFITYMFMHGNFSHLFFNMFALWMFGYALENYWGSKRFLVYYLITGVNDSRIASICRPALYQPDSHRGSFGGRLRHPAGFRDVFP